MKLGQLIPQEQLHQIRKSVSEHSKERKRQRREAHKAKQREAQRAHRASLVQEDLFSPENAPQEAS